MKNIFDPDNFFWRWFGKMADVLVLSCLWLLCCLPVVTIGASGIALYDAVAQCVHGTREHPYKYFFHVFKSELLRGIGITVLWGVLAFGLMMGYNVVYQLSQTNVAFSIYSMVYLGSLLIPAGILAWLLPIEARFSYGFFGLHKAAASFTIVHLPTTALVLGVLALAVVISFFVPGLIFLMPGLVVTLQSWLIEKVFKQYIDEEEEKETDDTAV